MISFALFAALMLLLAIGLLVRPLLRAQKDDTVERQQVNLDIYQQRLAELDKDLAEAQIEQHEYQEAQQDLEKQLIVDIPEQAQLQVNTRNSRSSLISILIIVPTMAITLYLYLGTPESLNMDTSARQASTPHAGARQSDQPAPSVEEMIVKLEQRLQQEPNDAKGLFLLARAYMHTQQFKKAEQTLEKLTKIVTNDANIWANYADIVAVNNQGGINDKAYEFVKRALAIDPKHLKALWLAGTYQFQQQSYAKAIRFWEIMRKELPADSKDYQTISASIADARKRGGIEAPAQQAAPSTAQPSSSAASASISGRVLISENLKDKVAPTDTVFVYARAVSGPRMPLAIVRKQVSDLPFDFSLDDSMAMMAQMKLSNFDKVVVSARVSKSGNAITQSGDLISDQPVVNVSDNEPLTLKIQHQVP